MTSLHKHNKATHRLPTFFHRYLHIPYTLHVYEFRSPKHPKATFVLIHGIGNTLHSWDEVVAKMPRNVRVIGIDLLGFGKSPQPHWPAYDVKTQARSVGATLVRLKLTQQPIIVGHSLGALVAVELAKRYPFIPNRLVLCGPPFYKINDSDNSKDSDVYRVNGSGVSRFTADTALRSLYKTATRHPEQLVHLSPLLVKMGLANKSLSITDANIASYISALETSIINQTSLTDVATLKLPVTIIYGIFDPVVVSKHITQLSKSNDNIVTIRVPYAHEIIGGYVDELSAYLTKLVAS